LDLVEEYPELVKLIKNKHGVLTIELDGDGVKEILSEAEGTMIATQNASLQANLNVSQKREELMWSEMGNGEYVETY
jgi:hypothetical protein